MASLGLFQEQCGILISFNQLKIIVQTLLLFKLLSYYQTSFKRYQSFKKNYWEENKLFFNLSVYFFHLQTSVKRKTEAYLKFRVYLSNNPFEFSSIQFNRRSSKEWYKMQNFHRQKGADIRKFYQQKSRLLMAKLHSFRGQQRSMRQMI